MTFDEFWKTTGHDPLQTPMQIKMAAEISFHAGVKEGILRSTQAIKDFEFKL